MHTLQAKAKICSPSYAPTQLPCRSHPPVAISLTVTAKAYTSEARLWAAVRMSSSGAMYSRVPTFTPGTSGLRRGCHYALRLPYTTFHVRCSAPVPEREPLLEV